MRAIKSKWSAQVDVLCHESFYDAMVQKVLDDNLADPDFVTYCGNISVDPLMFIEDMVGDVLDSKNIVLHETLENVLVFSTSYVEALFCLDEEFKKCSHPSTIAPDLSGRIIFDVGFKDYVQ